MKLFLWSLKFKLNVKCSFSNCNFTFHSTYAVPKCNCRNCAEKLSNLGHESMKICRKIVKSNKWCAGKIYLRSAYVAYNEFAVHNRRNSNYKISFCASELLLTTGAQFKWLNIFFYVWIKKIQNWIGKTVGSIKGTEFLAQLSMH